MVYLAVIPENTREGCGEVEGKQHGTVSRITMWAVGSVLLGTSQRPGRSNFGVISWGVRRLGYLSSNFSHCLRAPLRGGAQHSGLPLLGKGKPLDKEAQVFVIHPARKELLESVYLSARWPLHFSISHVSQLKLTPTLLLTFPC